MSSAVVSTPLLRFISRFDRIVVLSPHMDDAVLSCGGLLQHCVPQVLCTTLTVCTADPENADPENPPHGIALPSVRRGEEHAAMKALGCQLIQFDLPDAIYRRHVVTDQLLYPSLDSLWRLPLPDDDVQRRRLAKHLKTFLSDQDQAFHSRSILFLAPCGIGHHVDHILCTQTLLDLLPDTENILLYEDFPYVVDQGVHVGVADSAEKALTRLRVRGLERFEFECDVDAKISLIGHYPTQIDGIFGSADNVRPMLLKNASQSSTQERFWKIEKFS